MSIIKVKALKQGRKAWSNYEAPIYKGCKSYLTTHINKHGEMVTGLTKEDEVRLGEALNKDLRSTSPFWYDYRVILTGADLVLDLSKPEDELKFKVLSSHPEVAKSVNDKNPSARFVIYDEEQVAIGKSTKAEIKTKAFKLFSELTDNQKKDILKLYPGMQKASKESASVVTAKLFDLMESDPNKFITLVTDKNKETKIFIQDLLNAHILKKNGSAYKYGDDILGHNLEATVDYLSDPLNQSLKLALMNALKESK